MKKGTLVAIIGNYFVKAVICLEWLSFSFLLIGTNTTREMRRRICFILLQSLTADHFKVLAGGKWNISVNLSVLRIFLFFLLSGFKIKDIEP